MSLLALAHTLLKFSMITPQNLRIVLVEPEQPRNIGAIVRVAANFGLPAVTVVQNHELDDEELKDVRIASSGAVDLVDIRVFPTLPQALEGADAILGTSGRKRDTSIPVVTSVAAFLSRDETPTGITLAILFGRESTGLTTEELDLCHGLLRFPVSESFPSMNLSHAITVAVYQALFCTEMPRMLESAETYETIAPTDLQERWLSEFAMVTGIKSPQLRRLLHRAKPTPEDMAMLFNLVKQCRRTEPKDASPN